MTKNARLSYLIEAMKYFFMDLNLMQLIVLYFI